MKTFEMTMLHALGPVQRIGAGALFVAAMWAGSASGQSLNDALAHAYTTNPTLQAARASLRATDEQVPQALSNWLPQVVFTGDAGLSNTFDSNLAGTTSGKSLRLPYGAELSFDQTIYNGGSNSADFRQAQEFVQQERANLIDTEQTVLLDGVTTYVNVVRDQAVLELNLNNEVVLQRQLEATQDRFDVGETTRTDVAQAESRVANARAQRVQAEGALMTSRAEFERVIGLTPGPLVEPVAPRNLPTSLDSVVANAREGNPSVLAAQHAEAAAEEEVESRKGTLRPSFQIIGSVSHDTSSSFDGSRFGQGAVTGRVTIPLYQRGAAYSQIRESKQLLAESRHERDDAQRAAVEDATTAWEALETARAEIAAFESEVRAQEIALEGVRQESLVGSRTVLDVLDQEQELLDAQVNLVTVKRDALVAAYQVLSAMGALTASNLGLEVEQYDGTGNYDRVRSKWFGSSID